MDIDSSLISGLFNTKTQEQGNLTVLSLDSATGNVFGELLNQQLSLAKNNVSALQNIAAVAGMTLPPGVQLQDIDLDELQQELKDILAKIDLSAQSENLFRIDQKTDENTSLLKVDEEPQLEEVECFALWNEQLPGNMNQDVSTVLDNTDPLKQSEVQLSASTQVASEASMPRSVGFLQNQDSDAELTGIENLPLSPQQDDQLTDQDRNNDSSKMDQPLVETRVSHATSTEIDNSQWQNLSSRMTAQLGSQNRAAMSAELPPLTQSFAQVDWGNELAQRIVWMHKQEMPSAQLNIHPRHLGPLEIRVDVAQDQASVAFTVHHAQVKEALEAALPRLREMLGTQQLNLVNVDVSQHQSEQRQASNQSGAESNAFTGNASHFSDNTGASLETSLSDEIEVGRGLATQGLISIFA